MVKNDLSEAGLESYAGQIKVLNIFPSIDTPTCATSVRQFNKLASDYNAATVLNISKDLPFAQKRFCGAEGIDKVEAVSVFNSDFSKSYGLEITNGPLKGLCSRAIVILGKDNEVLYTEQVSEIANEPNYDEALNFLKNNL